MRSKLNLRLLFVLNVFTHLPSLPGINSNPFRIFRISTSIRNPTRQTSEYMQKTHAKPVFNIPSWSFNFNVPLMKIHNANVRSKQSPVSIHKSSQTSTTDRNAKHPETLLFDSVEDVLSDSKEMDELLHELDSKENYDYYNEIATSSTTEKLKDQRKIPLFTSNPIGFPVTSISKNIQLRSDTIEKSTEKYTNSFYTSNTTDEVTESNWNKNISIHPKSSNYSKAIANHEDNVYPNYQMYGQAYTPFTSANINYSKNKSVPIIRTTTNPLKQNYVFDPFYIPPSTSTTSRTIVHSSLRPTIKIISSPMIKIRHYITTQHPLDIFRSPSALGSPTKTLKMSTTVSPFSTKEGITRNVQSHEATFSTTIFPHATLDLDVPLIAKGFPNAVKWKNAIKKESLNNDEDIPLDEMRQRFWQLFLTRNQNRPDP